MSDTVLVNLDLIYQEICHREECGEEVVVQEYLDRFPRLAQKLPALFEIHAAMSDDWNWQGEAESPDHPIPFSARYSHIRELGIGGLGRVYLAFDSTLGRQVALKKLRPEFNQSRHHNERFRREASLTAKLSHSSVIEIYDLGRDTSGDYYYSMKLIDGKSLDELTMVRKNQQISWGDHPGDLRCLINLIARICDGLEHAHSRGIVHRDIKPANILVGDCGEVSLVDWGVAGYIRTEPGSPSEATYDEMLNQAGEETLDAITEDWPAQKTGESDSNACLTLDGMRLGTPAFMSPEQRSSARSATAFSDQYAVEKKRCRTPL